LKKESLVVVVPGGPGVPPICKIMNKEAMRAAEKAKAKAGRGVVTTKTIELNWAIDGNDLTHRIAKLKGFLEKGYRVEVVLAPKKKGRKATEEDAERVMGRIKGAVGEVRGAKEFKPMEGKLLGLTTLCFEGKVRKEKRQEQEQEAETEAQGDQSFF
jgi:translation initiation factor IF-3